MEKLLKNENLTKEKEVLGAVKGFAFTSRLIAHLEKLGQALDRDIQVSVFSGGFVGLNREDESEVNAYATQHGPSTRPRPGRRASWRERTACEARPFCSGAVEDAFGVGFRVLAQQYEALGFDDNDGLWVVAKSNPLGSDGPQVHFLIGVPLDTSILPKAWAFGRTGPNASLLSLKHTNFPDASICAFTKSCGAWEPTDGLLALVDHYSTWVVKKWHREVFGWWPGPQAGSCALYRRLEFDGREWCGCDSGKRYAECHQAIDLLVDVERSKIEFRSLFIVNYEDRAPPYRVLEAAKTRWKRLPKFSEVF